jgi:retinol dehydrogenase-14
MPDMHGKTVLITGATSGIGRATAEELARAGARVLVHGRSAESAAAAASAISRAARSDRIAPVHGDLASLEDVRRLAKQAEGASDRLDVLLNNAGVYMPQRTLTVDGLETTWAVNHLAHFALTLLLADLLAESTPARVITMSSVSHFRGDIDFGDINAVNGYDAYRAYAASKLMNVLFALELAFRWAGTGITSNTLHPGVIDTKLLHLGFPGQHGASPTVGAATPIYLASSPDVEDTTGRYFVNQHPAAASPQTDDLGLRSRLWQLSERLTGLTTD